MLKKILTIIAIFFFSISSIAILLKRSEIMNYQKGGFSRIFFPFNVPLLKTLELKSYPYYYIAGLSKTKIYLASDRITNKIIVTDYNLKDTQEINLVTSPYKINWAGVEIKIDSPHIYLMEGITPTILHGTLNPFNISQIDIGKLHYESILPISFSSLILKKYDKKLKQSILVKKEIDSPFIIPNRQILQKQIDGRFCEDGKILRSPDAKRLVYVYSYRNQFILLDTNLNILYKQNTIDTNYLAKIKVKRVESEDILTLASPPKFVNTRTWVTDSDIYINSGIMAENENRSSFINSSVIDVYSLKNGKYKFSFYLPDINSSKVNSFGVYGNKLIVTYKNNKICIYESNFF
jgi:hypothetical protein